MDENPYHSPQPETGGEIAGPPSARLSIVFRLVASIAGALSGGALLAMFMHEAGERSAMALGAAIGSAACFALMVLALRSLMRLA